MNIAKKLIRAAKSAGADCVKFQKSSLTEKFTKSALERPYDSKNSFGKTYGEHKEFLEFSTDEYIELMRFCENDVNIPMTASAMDPESVDFLENIKAKSIDVFFDNLSPFHLQMTAHSGRVN